MIDAIGWVFWNLGHALWSLVWAITHPAAWLDWTNPEAVFRVVYYGGSTEFFFVVFLIFLGITIAGIFFRGFLWGVVRALEGFSNGLGRIAAWAGLIMVLQQVVIIFMQRIFAVTNLGFGLGATSTHEISWWAEELKFYNAIVVALCVSYTFVQKGHVRVDLVYSPLSFRGKRMVDMLGSLFFMMPFAVLTWMYSWYFMWRHLITPKVSASDTLDRMMAKAAAFRWNVETISFSPNGFSAYFLFKILMVAFCGLVFLQAATFFWRSWLEWREGPESEDRYLDLDTLEPAEESERGARSLEV